MTIASPTPNRDRAVLYLRLSVTGDETSQSLATQESDLRRKTAELGATVTRVFTDDGLSGGKARAKADEALRMLRADEADILLVWKFDRWSRQGIAAVAALVDVLDARTAAKRPALFVPLKDGWTSDDGGTWRMTAAIMSEVARAERDNTALRVTSAINTLRHSGRFAGGTVPIPYRIAPNPVGPGSILVPDEAEAAIIREAAHRIIGGEPLYRVCLDFNRRGIPAPRSPYRRAARHDAALDGVDRGTWRVQSLRRTMTGDALVGRVTHRGDVIRTEDGMPATVWEPIITPAELALLRDRLITHRAEQPATRRVRQARLLSGIASCAVCGGRMYVKSSRGSATYFCPAAQNGEDCPSPRAQAAALEAHVVSEARERRGDLPMTETIRDVSQDAAILADLAEVEIQLKGATAAMLDDDDHDPELFARIGYLKNARARLRAKVASPEVFAIIRETGHTWSQDYDTATDDDTRRSLLVLAGLDAVKVGPMRTRTNILDPARVELIWTE